jgi:hypothetical protein
MGVRRVFRLCQTQSSARTFDSPDNGLGLKSGLTLLVDYRADSVLAASLARAVKNLIHHFDRRDLRPNKVGLPRH